MRYHIFGIIALIAFVSQVQCGCDKSSEESGESDVIHFFKNVGCDIKKGAEKVSDTAKPWVDEIGKSAKKFGNTVADKFSDLREKVTGGSNSTSGEHVVSTTDHPSISDKPTPMSVDTRVLLEVEPRCPEGQLSDGRGHCRPIA